MRPLKKSDVWIVLTLAVVLSFVLVWRVSEQGHRVSSPSASVDSGSRSYDERVVGTETKETNELGGPKFERLSETVPSRAAADAWNSSTLVRLTVSRDFRALADALKDPPPYGLDSERDGAWIEALRALSSAPGDDAQRERSEAVALLRQLFTDERLGVRDPSERPGFLVHLAEALADTADVRVVLDLAGLVDDRSQPIVVRSAAAVALTRFQNGVVKPALERYRSDLQEALEEMGTQGGSVFELKEFLAEADALLAKIVDGKESP